MLFVAIVVDPRYKLEYVKFWFKQWYDKEKDDELGLRVRNALNRLLKYYNGSIGFSSGANASRTRENSGNDDTSMSSMLSSFGNAKE